MRRGGGRGEGEGGEGGVNKENTTSVISQHVKIYLGTFDLLTFDLITVSVLFCFSLILFQD